MAVHEAHLEDLAEAALAEQPQQQVAPRQDGIVPEPAALLLLQPLQLSAPPAPRPLNSQVADGDVIRVS